MCKEKEMITSSILLIDDEVLMMNFTGMNGVKKEGMNNLFIFIYYLFVQTALVTTSIHT